MRLNSNPPSPQQSGHHPAMSLDLLPMGDALSQFVSPAPHILELSPPTPAPDVVAVPRAPGIKVRSPEATTLRETRLAMGMTMMQMAEAFGVSHSLYCGMEYGRNPVRPEIMERLKEIKESSSEVSSSVANALAKGVHALIEDWAKRLRATEVNDSNLASLLGVDKSTISRWKSGRQSPTPRQIIAIEHNVSLNERSLNKSAEAMRKHLGA